MQAGLYDPYFNGAMVKIVTSLLVCCSNLHLEFLLAFTS